MKNLKILKKIFLFVMTHITESALNYKFLSIYIITTAVPENLKTRGKWGQNFDHKCTYLTTRLFLKSKLYTYITYPSV